MERLVMTAAMSAVSVMVLLSTLTVAAAAIIYIVARWRTARESKVEDPQLGFKTAASYFQVLALQIVLVGIFLLVYGVLTDMKGDGREQLFRLGAGLAIPGFLVLLGQTFALRHSNAAEFPIVSRLSEGWNLLLVGMIGLVALVTLSVTMFQEDPPTELKRFAWAFALVYTGAWIGLGASFMRRWGGSGGGWKDEVADDDAL